MENLATSLWFRKEEMESIQAHTLRKTIRLGDRSETTVDPKGGYKIGSIISLKILLPDNSFSEYEARVRIDDVIKKKIEELSAEDFENGSDNQRLLNTLLISFGHYYNKEFNGQEIVSVISFSYLEK